MCFASTIKQFFACQIIVIFNHKIFFTYILQSYTYDNLDSIVVLYRSTDKKKNQRDNTKT
jgi:hypothetical protein